VLYLVVRNVSKLVGYRIRRDEDRLLNLRPGSYPLGDLLEAELVLLFGSSP
jgi:hypothetical protein